MREEEQLSATFIPITAQCDLQAMIDNCHYNNLLASGNIRNQARIMVLSHPYATSSGWLKAMPPFSLGLAIYEPEFVVGLRLWLEPTRF